MVLYFTLKSDIFGSLNMIKGKKNKTRTSNYSLGFLILFLFSFTSGIASSFSLVSHDKTDFKEFSFEKKDNSSSSSSDGFIFNEIEEDEDNLEPGFILLPSFLILEQLTLSLNFIEENFQANFIYGVSVLLVTGGLRI